MALPRRAWARGSGIVFGYALLSAWITWPLVTRAGTSLAGDFGDPVFVSWVMAWVADHLTALMGADLGAWGAMWNAPIFAPDLAKLSSYWRSMEPMKLHFWCRMRRASGVTAVGVRIVLAMVRVGSYPL